MKKQEIMTNKVNHREAIHSRETQSSILNPFKQPLVRSKQCRTHFFWSCIIFASLSLLLAACSPSPPTHQENICTIFNEYPQWYWAAKDVRDRWHIPISVLMSVMYSESRFTAAAKPPRDRLLFIVPWQRPSTAYGYSQALNQTWRNYQADTGHHNAYRDEFSDAADFIGWYSHQIALRTGIPISNSSAYAIYLAYHEGITGYINGSYRKKPWLVSLAKQVQRRAWDYQTQLLSCEKDLPQKPWWRL